MNKHIFKFESIGLVHSDPAGFFRFLVIQRFSQDSNRSLQWCDFDGLNLIVTTLEPGVIGFVAQSLKAPLKTKAGHDFRLIN